MFLTCGYVTVPMTWGVEEKTASVYTRIYFIEGGDVLYESETEKKRLKKNHIYCFPNKVPYRIVQNPKDCLSCTYVHIDITPYVISNLREISIERDPLAGCLMNAFRESCSGLLGEATVKVQQKLSDAMMEYLICRGQLEVIDVKISDSILYMIQHIKEELEIEKLSAISGYHPQYYIRLFKKCMGMTPHQYLIQYRMKMALILLNNGMNVSKTAEQVGYKESKNLCRAFKATYGILPHQVSSLMDSTSGI